MICFVLDHSVPLPPAAPARIAAALLAAAAVVVANAGRADAEAGRADETAGRADETELGRDGGRRLISSFGTVAIVAASVRKSGNI